jgi:uncharacterized protein (DUF2164 family)
MNQTFSRQTKDELINKIQVYFQNELNQELGNFETEFLLDYFSEHVGPFYYNQAIRDVQIHLAGYLENMNERIDELEKPLPR